MTILISPILADTKLQADLDKVKGKLLFNKKNGTLIYISDFELTDQEKWVDISKWWGRTRMFHVNQKYLTGITLMGWNTRQKKWISIDESFIQMIFEDVDLAKMRIDYIERIKNPLISMGFKCITDE